VETVYNSSVVSIKTRQLCQAVVSTSTDEFSQFLAKSICTLSKIMRIRRRWGQSTRAWVYICVRIVCTVCRKSTCGLQGLAKDDLMTSSTTTYRQEHYDLPTSWYWLYLECLSRCRQNHSVSACLQSGTHFHIIVDQPRLTAYKQALKTKLLAIAYGSH